MEIFLSHDRQVQQGRTVLGLLFQGLGEKLRRVVRPSALEANHSEFGQGLGVFGIQPQRLAQTSFGGDQFSRTGLGLAELQPALGRIWPPQGVGGEFGLG